MNKPEKCIQTEIVVEASIEEVWDAWTTENGIKSFLAPACDINLSPGGKYEIYFNPDAPYGEKGGEGLVILATDHLKMLSFTWNAPPSLPLVRNQKTHVTVRFEPESEKLTRVSLNHDGWGSGGEWEKAFEYFEQAWGKIVLPRLKFRFEQGSIDWSNPPRF